MKLLLIEDNAQLNEELTLFLKEEGYITEKAYTYKEASDKINVYKYDLVIVDIGLPDGSGFDIITELKSRGRNKRHFNYLREKNAIPR